VIKTIYVCISVEDKSTFTTLIPLYKVKPTTFVKIRCIGYCTKKSVEKGNKILSFVATNVMPLTYEDILYILFEILKNIVLLATI
jgi:hypothetical protein